MDIEGRAVCPDLRFCRNQRRRSQQKVDFTFMRPRPEGRIRRSLDKQWPQGTEQHSHNISHYLLVVFFFFGQSQDGFSVVLFLGNAIAVKV